MKCVKCGMSATVYNKAGVPVCVRHRNEKISSPTCPDCSSTMVIRNGKYGAFWGCSAYPMCEGLQKI
jgi:ssDNA-binding Zn-finger/Zn-ribbon topoisomerase 1